MAAVSAVASSNGLLAFLAFSFRPFSRLDERVPYLEEVFDVEGGLQAPDSTVGEGYGPPAVGAGKALLVPTFLDGFLQTRGAEDVEAREHSRVGVHLEANPALETRLDFFQSFFRYVLFCHCHTVQACLFSVAGKGSVVR